MKRLALLVPLALTGCAGLSNLLPHADFHVGFMGVEIGMDTRPVVNTIAGAATGATAGAVTGAAVTPKPK